MEVGLVKFCCLFWIVEVCFGLSVEYNCSSTYDAVHGMITTPIEQIGRTCMWRFTADPGDTFVLHFLDFESLSQLFTLCETTYLEVKDGSTEESPSLVGPKMCYIIQSTAKVRTKSNGLWVKLVTDSVSLNIKVIAEVRVESKTKRYQVYTDKLSWIQSRDRCLHEGGILAQSHPVPSMELQERVFMSSSAMWTGKSVTDWVWLLGCYEWKNEGRIKPIYKHSKYNQMAECAAACKGSFCFLVQGKSCYCLQSEAALEKVEFEMCNFTCPGNNHEKCGGEDTFTMYQFKSNKVLALSDDSDGTKNCAALTTSGEYTPQNCDILLPFSCSFENDTKTYIKVLPWHEAVDFCSRQNGSFGLSSIPKLTTEYFQESMWLGLRRGVDWGYPSEVKRNPERAFRAVEGLYKHLSIYVEQLRNATELLPFVCQFDIPNCGGNTTTSLEGNISTPNYPEPYNLGDNCLWTISTESDLVFIIEFQHFDIENGVDCMYDYVQFTQVLNEDVKVESPKECGKDLPVSFVAKTNHLEVRFKSDRSIAATGFALEWRLVNAEEARKWEDERKKPERAKAGVIVGVTIATTLVVILILCVVFLVYRIRRKRTAVIQDQTGSSINNAIYGINGSEFDEISLVNDNFRQYENVNSPNKPKLQGEISYNYENVEGKSIAVGVATADEKVRESKANLLLEMYHSDESENNDTEGKLSEKSTHKSTKSGNVHENAKIDTILKMADVESMGKDKIEVVDTTELDKEIDDGYIAIEEDMKKSIVEKDADNSLYENETNTAVNDNEYQYAYSMPLQMRKNSDPRYAIVENKEDEPANMDKHAYTGLQSPVHESHDPLVPQTSNLYIELQDV